MYGNLAAAVSLFCLGTISAVAETVGTYQSSAGLLTVEKIAGPFDHPWAIAFLPEAGTMLVTERPGTLRLVRDGVISAPVAGVPEVADWGQGGLLDVVPDPEFAANNLIYLSYAEPVGRHDARTSLLRARLVQGTGAARLEDARILFQQHPALSTGRHFGSRIVFGDDGTLFLTTGDRGTSDLVQKMDNTIGKVIRIRRDGSIPADNPYVNDTAIPSEIWSVGHRNPQGAAKRPADGAYVTVSHGPRGGDEVNRPEAGKNYGWPEISYGTRYSGLPFLGGSARDGLEQPLFYWDPSIAPSGAAFYEGDLFAQWRGHLLVGALKFQLISRLEPTETGFREAERLFKDDFGRVRDVRVGPEGAIWFAVDDSEGYLYRVSPQNVRLSNLP